MTVDWQSFTPEAALTGGVLIGLATTMFVLLNGRIAGISGILAGMLRPSRAFAWQASFVLGLLAIPFFWGLVAPLPGIRIDASWATLVMAGLLVGIGTRYGAGCTSGHGICGLSRLSRRSIVATLSFMGSGFVTVYLIRYVL